MDELLFYFLVTLGLIAIIAAIIKIFLVYDNWSLNKELRKLDEKVRQSQASSSSGKSSRGQNLTSRQAVTNWIKNNYYTVENAKRGRGRNDALLNEVYRAIEAHSVETRQLSARQKFAVLYLINRAFKKSRQRSFRTEELKNFLARTIVLYHRHEIRVEFISRGKYANCFEISLSPWCTHVPRHVLDSGKLERPGMPSVQTALGRKSPALKSTNTRGTSGGDAELEKAMEAFIRAVLAKNRRR